MIPRVLYLFLSLPWAVSGSHPRDRDLSMLSLSPDYNFLDPPPTASPLPVRFQINLRNVLGVNEIQQTLSLETSIRLFWLDPRVSLRDDSVDYVTFNPELLGDDVLWIPDVFLDGSKDLRSPTFQLRPSSLRVYSDSTLRFSSRVNFEVFCPMGFERYPNDAQECSVRFESFGYTTSEVIYEWDETGNNLNTNISLPNFDFTMETNSSYNTDKIYSLSYPGVSMKIHLKRKLTYHVLQTYLPSGMLVIISWLSLFIPVEETPGRVGMSTMSLVTLMALYGVVRKEVPQVSYTSLLDLWMFSTMSFVVLILFHYVILSLLRRHKKASLLKTLELLGRWGISGLFITFSSIYWGVLML